MNCNPQPDEYDGEEYEDGDEGSGAAESVLEEIKDEIEDIVAENIASLEEKVDEVTGGGDADVQDGSGDAAEDSGAAESRSELLRSGKSDLRSRFILI